MVLGYIFEFVLFLFFYAFSVDFFRIHFSYSMHYTLAYANYSIVVSSLGAELQSFQKWWVEYLYQKKEGFWRRQSPVLFPIVGGLRDGKYVHDGKEYFLSQHGFARDREFTLIQDARFKIQDCTAVVVIASESEAIHVPETWNLDCHVNFPQKQENLLAMTERNISSLTFQLVSDKQSREKYPFDFIFTITYILSDSGLRVEYSVSNTGNESLLFSIGWHPAFAIENIDEYSIRFEGEKDPLLVDRLEKWLLAYSEEIPLHDNELPLSESLFDNDAMIFRELQSQKVTLQKKNQKILEFDRGNFPHFALWKQPDAPFLCLEPWQWYADSVDSTGILSEKPGIVSLEVGESMDFWWWVSVG